MQEGCYLPNELTTLFLQMLFDYPFKQSFARYFIRRYHNFVQVLHVVCCKSRASRVLDAGCSVVF